MICPECASENIVKNGVKENGKQNRPCLICKRQFVENPSDHYRISEETRSLVDRLLLEKIPLAGIARAAQVSERWLQYYVNDLYENVSGKLTVLSKKKAFDRRV
jgi:transposase-like protein